MKFKLIIGFILSISFIGARAQHIDDEKLAHYQAECAGTFMILAKYFDHLDSKDIAIKMSAQSNKSLKIAFSLANKHNLPESFVNDSFIKYVFAIGDGLREDQNFWINYLITDAKTCQYVNDKF